jgi:Rho termination factor-like protein
MNKAELEKKSLSDLHQLAQEAGLPKYRMLSRGELIAQLADGDGGSGSKGDREQRAERPRRRREPRERSQSRGRREPREERAKPAREELPAEEQPAAPESAAAPREPAAEAEATPGPARPRRRRRRRFGRRAKREVTLQGLLLPPEAGRQAVLSAETREGCTTLLRGVAADLSADAEGPDPIVLLIDPSPEELADWKRDAPQAEIVSAGQPRHASDALAQATARAGKGEDVILLVDSLTRLAEAHGEAAAAKEFFDAGRAQGSAGGGSLTVVAALVRSAAN